MKAFLLAAGYGTRLRPLTNTIPKCMVPIHGLPLLGWWFDLFQKHGITEVMVNTHYLPDPVRAFIKKYNSTATGFTAYETYEQELLGSGGTIRANRAFVEHEENFLICYADNLTDANLSEFQSFHKIHNGILSMALFYTNLPEQCGIAELDYQDKIIEFVEKPDHPKSNLANAGMYIANNQIFKYFDSDKKILDFGKDILPQLIGKMFGWNVGGYLIDIGTPENYKKAKEDWPYDHY